MTLLQLFLRTFIFSNGAIVILLLFSRCKKQWFQNRFDISGVTIDSVSESKIHLNFELSYYSDSTKAFYIMQGIEKGLGGSDFTIDKIEIHGSNPKINNQMIDSTSSDDKDF